MRLNKVVGGAATLRPDHYGEYVGTAFRFFGKDSLRVSRVLAGRQQCLPLGAGLQNTGQEPLLALI